MESKTKNKPKNKLLDTENRLVVARDSGRGWGVSKWVKGVKRYKIPVISPRGIMYSIVTIVNNTVLYI